MHMTLHTPIYTLLLTIHFLYDATGHLTHGSNQEEDPCEEVETNCTSTGRYHLVDDSEDR